MDNISHAVVGLLAGEIIHRSLPEERDADVHQRRRSLLLVTGFAASNFPDLDLVLTRLLPEPLGYLLHHRGHTHTVLYLLPQALLLLAILWTARPSARDLLRTSLMARSGVILSMAVGFGSHLVMDFFNSYGVHPFHPFDSRWFYGDRVFIVEPLFWVAFGVPMTMTVQRAWLRRVMLGFLVGVPFAFTVAGFLPWAAFFVLLVISLATGWRQSRAGARDLMVLVASVMIGVSFVVWQSFASGQALRKVKDFVRSQAPQSRFLDSAMAPYPTNPLCWGFISIESDENEGVYRVRRGTMSLAPQLMPLSRCSSFLAEPARAENFSPSLAATDEIVGSLEQIRTLYGENCHFAAWMKFARVPFLSDDQAYDMRFQNAGLQGNFTSFSFEAFKDRECSAFVPEWGVPRADLLGLSVFMNDR